MRSRLISEGRSVPLGEPWFTRNYAVQIFSEAAILRWLKVRASVTNHAGELPYRILRIKTIMEMQYGTRSN